MIPIPIFIAYGLCALVMLVYVVLIARGIGHDKGRAEGYEAGRLTGYTEGYEAARAAHLQTMTIAQRESSDKSREIDVLVRRNTNLQRENCRLQSLLPVRGEAGRFVKKARTKQCSPSL